MLIIPSPSYSQQSEKEKALWKKYYSFHNDSSSVLTLVEIAATTYERDRILAEKIANKAVYEAKKQRSKSALARALSSLANIYFDNGKYEESYYLADDLLKISDQIDDPLIVGDAYKIMGRRYHFRGEYPKALENYLKSLEYFERLKVPSPISDVHKFIGGVYLNQKDFKNAYNYYHKSQLMSFAEKNARGIASGYLNISNVFMLEGTLQKAKNFLDSAEQYYKLEEVEAGIAYVYGTRAEIFILENKNDSAMKNLLLSYGLLKKLNKFYTLTQVNTALADLYLKAGDSKNALHYVDEGIDISNKTRQIHNIAPLLLLKSKIFEKSGKLSEALQNYKLYKSFSDSVLNEGSIKKQAEDALKFDYNKKEYQQELEKQAELAKQNEKETQQRYYLNLTIIGMALLSAILFLVIRSYRNNQKNSKIIAEQKSEVEKQHHLLQEKNKEVLDSINYAKRLQNAILPSTHSFKKYFPKSFVLYKPKDIVAGDFYWMEKVNGIDPLGKEQELILFAAADCTGHGVPGSLVSVVCSNALNRAIFEFALTDPGKILDKTRELVIATFEKSDSDVKDGMDISLCVYNPEKNKLQWAGANNPLWILKYDGNFIEIKANKQPIGKYTSTLPFTTHEIELKKGDTVYVFTDGYADQFGGERAHLPGSAFGHGKKFKYNQLKTTLHAIGSNEPEVQCQLLEEKFNDWKGNLEQVDDVCIIGVKF